MTTSIKSEANQVKKVSKTTINKYRETAISKETM